MPDPTYIAGQVKQNSAGLPGRMVAVFGFYPDQQTNRRQLLGQALTTADGTYQVAFPEGGTELALVLVFDDGGQPWTASTALAVGLRVSPAPFNGILYEVTVAGDSGETEPDWQALADNNGGAIGAAITTRVAYQQPLASGPVRPSTMGV